MKKSVEANPSLCKHAEDSAHLAFICDARADFVYFNTAWLHYRGTTLLEECARPAQLFVHTDDAEAFIADIARLSHQHEPVLTWCRVLNAAGSYIWFRFVVSPTYSSKGDYTGCIAYGQDVQARKQQEELSRRFAAIMASMEAGIIIKDKAGHIIDWSDGAQNILGYTRQEVLGKTAALFAHKTNASLMDKINTELTFGKHSAFINTEAVHKKGHVLVCSVSFTPFWGEGGEVEGSVVIFHDVTVEKQAEEKRLAAKAALRASHTNIAAILSEIPTPICVISEQSGQIMSCNLTFAHLCGGTEASLQNSSISDLLHGQRENLSESVDSFLARLRAGNTFACQLTKSDGSLTPVDIMARPFTYQEQAAFAVHCTDLTLRDKHEKALHAAVLAAEDASRMKSTFVANMSHEIRTPLNGVVGFAELALDEPDLPPVVSTYLQNIKISAHGLLEIINDVLDISKIEAGKIDLENVPFDLHTDILQICETIIGEKAKEKNVILYLYSEPIVHRKFLGDPTRLRQILLNLLTNAIKFTNVGIVKLMLSVEERGASSTIFFEVKDSGIGMSPAQMEHIFAPFIQADSSTTRKFGGTGLGLTITKNLIELMGGTLQVESAPGIGSKFSFALTFETITDDSPTIVQPAAVPHSHVKPQFEGNVLICEDNTINQQVIQEHLLKVGLQSTVTPNGKLGVEQAKLRMRQGNPFDLIFMDIHMPIMDGLEATQKLHELGICTPIIALTANAMTTDKEKYLAHGMADYLAKPFKAYELWDCLCRHLTPLNAVPAQPKHAADAPAQAPAMADTLTDAQAKVPQATQSANMAVTPLAGTPLTTPLFAASQASYARLDSSLSLASTTFAALDRTLGIENAAGDPALYQRLLLNFVTDNTNTASRLSEALDSGNTTLAHRLAHTLKSVAATIGATKLAHIASELEIALTNGDAITARHKIDRLSLALNAVLSELFSLQDRPQPRPCADRVDKAKALTLIQTIEPLLEEANLESLEYLDAVRAIILPLGELGQELVHQIDDYDFEPALMTLQKIKDLLEAQDA